MRIDPVIRATHRGFPAKQGIQIMVSDSFRATWSPRLLSVIRILVGLMFMQHGLTKYFGFPLPTPAGFQAASMVGVAGVIEIVCGALVALGLFGRVAAFLASGEMAIGYFMFHAPKGFFPQANGGEQAIFYCFVFLYIALEGGGPWSLDAARSRS
jgi:putative oxidoreductase